VITVNSDCIVIVRTWVSQEESDDKFYAVPQEAMERVKRQLGTPRNEDLARMIVEEEGVEIKPTVIERTGY
jgi:hypothetical protein